jgi:hypothetical protein
MAWILKDNKVTKLNLTGGLESWLARPEKWEAGPGAEAPKMRGLDKGKP